MTIDGEVKRRSRVLFWGMYLAYLWLLAFLAMRAAIWIVYRVPVTESVETVDPCWRFYRELFERQIVDPHPGAGTLRVLLLGGSVAEQTGPALEARLESLTGRSVRVDNAAKSAHTTRDSLNKLEYLVEQSVRFDVIVVYHGINDVKLNCVPSDEFREDYSHFGWYRQFDELRRSPGPPVYTLLKDSFLYRPPPANRTAHQQQMDWGNEIKTPPAFEANVRRIVALAAECETPLILMTFATWIPDNYTTEDFYAGKLGYGDGHLRHSTETWGWADNVRRTVKAHNEAIRRVAADHPECPLVDIEVLMQEPRDFSDVCHFTDLGISRFVDHAAPVIAAAARPE